MTDIPANNKLENAIKNVEIKENQEYKMKLIVKIRDREYILSTFEFNTKEGEILGISSVEEYKDIQPEGNYIILTDLDFRDIKNSSDMAYRFGGRFSFDGKIDYNGKRIYINILSSGIQPLFYIIGENAQLINMNIEIYMNNELPTNGSIIFFNNKGNIINLRIEIKECTEKNNSNINIVGSQNYGNISNFIIKLSDNLYGYNIQSITSNYGQVKNGYLYGKNIHIVANSSGVTSNSALINANYGIVRNIYSLINIDAEEIKSANDTFSKLIQTNEYGITENIYTVGIGTGYQLEKNANTGRGGGRINNSYYINNQTFLGTGDIKTTEKSLYDTDFQEQILNSEEMFIIDEMIDENYYPQLILPECMPRQDFLQLPEIEDSDLPDIVSSKVLKKYNQKAEVEINIYNPSGEIIQEIIVNNLTTKILSQTYKNKHSTVIIELTNPIMFVSSYSITTLTTKGAYNLPYSRKYNEGERKINVDLYKEIYSIEDWKEIKKSTKENYKLMSNLDFKNENASTYTNIDFFGILDGNNYTIRNIIINNGNPLFTIVRPDATICNLTICNYYIDGNSIFNSCNKANFYNINLEEITIESNKESSINQNIGIISAGEGAKLINFGADNVKIEVKNKTGNINIGGIIANGAADIERTYITDLEIEEINNSSINSIGGIVGYFNRAQNTLKETYVEGNINSNSGYIGGIIGRGGAVVSNSYAVINIIGNGDYIGGIVGNNSNSEIINQNNLFVGNIINKKDSNYTNNFVGNNVNMINSYNYVTNKINGKVVESYVLTEKQLKNIFTYVNILKLGETFCYDEVTDGKLPKLKNIETGELLPNQKDIYIPVDDISIEKIETLKLGSSKIEIQLTIKNLKQYNLNKITIEDMETVIEENRTINGKTYIKLTATPIKYFDVYRINSIQYTKENENIYKKTYDIIKESFYKEITSYEDWQNIDSDSYENYRLLTDIDFEGKEKIRHNIKINKLITEGQVHTLKNINLDLEEFSTGLIKEIKNLIENIKFENIKIVNENLSANYIGIIAYNSGNMTNIEFKDINISLGNNANYIGCVSKNTGINIKNITLNNINIKANDYVGGLFGVSSTTYMNNFNVKEINIIASSYIGGLIGYRDVYTGVTDNNLSTIYIESADINGKNYVGGVYGGNSGNGYLVENITVIESNIVGEKYIGGIAGSSGYNGKGVNNVELIDSTIKGNSYIGGLLGTGGNLTYGIVDSSEIISDNSSSMYIGGAIGYLNWAIQGSRVVESKIISQGSIAGGIVGYGNGSGILNSISLNNEIIGVNKIGGIAGCLIKGNIVAIYTNCKVKAINSVGGIVGFLDNSIMDNQTNITNIYNNYLACGIVEGRTNVGGIIGEIATELYDKTTTDYYKQNYIEATLISEDNSTTSLGIGNMPEEISKVKDTYFYKYSNVNGKNPSKENEPYIKEEQYLVEEQLKQETTYTNNLKWGTANFDYNILTENKYPILKYNNEILPNQEGIDIPKDEEHIIDSESNENNNNIVEEQTETIENTFEYADKEIETYSTYSIIQTSDGNSVRRDIKLYAKENKLYGIPISFVNNTGEEITPVANNLIVDSYNGKEYETILGSDGKMYDLKEEIEYPEEFENKDIESIGNNLETDEKEVEVKYKNGDIVKFNYQTGEIIKTSKTENKQNLLEYIGDKLTEIGEEKTKVESISTKYEESKELENKLEDLPIEEAIQKNNTENNENRNDVSEKNENEESNNSEKEKKYISIYNEEKGEYQIYNEAELLDTEKEEVESENEKIEANNLKEYYAKGQESKNEKQGIVWIVISIIGVGIVLLILRKNLKKKR